MINKSIKSMCVIGFLGISLLLHGCTEDSDYNKELFENSPFELVKEYHTSDALLDTSCAVRDTNTNIMYWYVVNFSPYEDARSGFSVMYNENGDVMTYSEYIEKGY